MHFFDRKNSIILRGPFFENLFLKILLIKWRKAAVVLGETFGRCIFRLYFLKSRQATLFMQCR
jgi:hypothetical protein